MQLQPGPTRHQKSEAVSDGSPVLPARTARAVSIVDVRSSLSRAAFAQEVLLLLFFFFVFCNESENEGQLFGGLRSHVEACIYTR